MRTKPALFQALSGDRRAETPSTGSLEGPHLLCSPRNLVLIITHQNKDMLGQEATPRRAPYALHFETAIKRDLARGTLPESGLRDERTCARDRVRSCSERCTRHGETPSVLGRAGTGHAPPRPRLACETHRPWRTPPPVSPAGFFITGSVSEWQGPREAAPTPPRIAKHSISLQKGATEKRARPCNATPSHAPLHRHYRPRAIVRAGGQGSYHQVTHFRGDTRPDPSSWGRV